MSVLARRERSVERSKSLLRFRPVIVTCEESYVLALLCAAGSDYYLALWDKHSHQLNAKELDVETATFCKSIGSMKLSHVQLRIVYPESDGTASGDDYFSADPLHFIVVGGGRDFICRWVLSRSGNILHFETKELLESPIDFLSVDDRGENIVSFERSKVVVRDAYLRIGHLFRLNKETPTDCKFVYTHDKVDAAKPRFLVCCFESGLVAAWDLREYSDIETSISAESLFLLNLSGATSSATVVCCLVQVDACIIPAQLKKNHAPGAESRRFCISSRDGKVWVIEWSLRDPACCKEVKFLDLQKQMRYKSELKSMGSKDYNNKGSSSTEKASYKLDGVATALTAPSASSAAVRIESVFSVLTMCSTKLTASPTTLNRPGNSMLFIITTNGMLVSVNIEDLKIVSQVVVNDGSGGGKLGSVGGGSPVLLAAVSSLPGGMSSAFSTDSSRKCPAEKSNIMAIAVVITAFDRKIYMCPACVSCEAAVRKSAHAAKNITELQESLKISDTKVVKESSKNSDGNSSKLPAWAMRANKDIREIIQTSPVVKRHDKGFIDNHLSDSNFDEDDDNMEASLSFFRLSRSPLPPKAPLMAGQNPVTPLPTSGRYSDSANSANRSNRASSTAQGKGSWEKPAKTKGGAPMDLPVTFHTRIKSSGYNAASTKKHQLGRSLSAPKTGKRNAAKSTDRTVQNSRLRSYPKTCTPFTTHQQHNDYPPKESNIPFTPLMDVNFSEDGSLLGLVTGGSAVCTLKTPLGRFKGDGNFYMGHDSQINTVEFSHKDQMVVSSSEDGTARIWKQGKVDAAAVVFSHRFHQPSVSGPSPVKISSSDGKVSSRRAATPLNRNKPFGGPISRASFYYMDKFVLLTSKTSVLMYTYNLHDFEAKNDLKRLQATGKYKLAHEWTPRGEDGDTSQSITTSACLNSVESPLILAGTFDRKLLVLDAITGGISRNIDSAHDRSIHCIALPKPSVHVPMSQSAYNVFATSATDNVISLWDLRTPRSTSRLTGHVNRREKCQCAFSPCMRYLTTASEDRSARIYDIRGGKEIAKLSGQHRDVVSSVSYHPIHPQLVTASYDGSLKFYVGDD